MAKLMVLIGMVCLSACGQSPEVAVAQNAEGQIASEHLPFDNSTGFLDGYSLRVTRRDATLWNGTPVTSTDLKHYLDQWAALPRDAGSLYVAFEPGISSARAEWVRRQVIDSGLCKQRRCWEVGWDVKRPVVN